jgi:ABC-type uncharacterized transport system permease subunit
MLTPIRRLLLESDRLLQLDPPLLRESQALFVESQALVEESSPLIQQVHQLLPIPAVTLLVIVGFCLLNTFFLRTKLGQDCRSVGQSQPIANAAGINVDRTRIIATIISTVLAAWGMIIYLQDMGTVSAYTAQRQIGMFAVAALLVGGATAAKATARNAIIGLVLFHSMFIVSPGIGRLLPIPSENAENVAEYIRSFMMYSVIGVSLGLHVWKLNKAAKNKASLGTLIREKNLAEVIARRDADKKAAEATELVLQDGPAADSLEITEAIEPGDPPEDSQE